MTDGKSPAQQGLPYQLLNSEDNPLLTYFGDLCISYENYIFRFMRRHAGDAYTGGVYEFRLYPNGVMVMVLPDTETMVQYDERITLSLECLSYVASAFFFNGVNAQAYEAGDDDLNNIYYDLCFGLKDVISGELRFVIENKAPAREPTE